MLVLGGAKGSECRSVTMTLEDADYPSCKKQRREGVRGD